jgi:hypothetical protein
MRKLLFGAYLSFPLMSRVYLSAGFSLPSDMLGFMQLYIFNVTASFFSAWILYSLIECPIGDGLKLVVTDIVKEVHRIRSK